MSRRSAESRWIGRSEPRPDGADKVTGRAAYVDDLGFPGMLHAQVVRCPVPHARILSVRTAPALIHPAAVAAATAAEVPGENVVHVIYDDQPVFAEGTSRYIGEPLAVIGATSRRGAAEAAALVEIDYVELSSEDDPVAAMRGDAPQIAVPEVVDRPPNVFNEMRIRRGDVDRGFAEAAVVVEQQYAMGYQEHAYLEPQGVVAVPDAGGAMTVYGSMQCPFYIQAAVARVLGLPLSKVRVVHAVTGGAFGGKEDVPSHLASIAAVLAHTARRPVKLVLGREEDILTTSKRHPAVVRFRTGATAEGVLTALEAELVYNAGAYQTLSSAVLWRGLVTAPGPYRIPNVRVDAFSVATNTVPCGAFRGFGSPQVIFAHESQMDLLAARLGMDRVEIRRRNLLQANDLTATGQRLDESTGVADTLERAATMASWPDTAAACDRHNTSQPRMRRGVGVCSVMYGVGLGGKAPFLDKAGAYVKLEADGSVAVAVGTVEMGQGLTGALSQVVVNALGVPMQRVHFAPADTSRVPDSGPTVASRGTIMSALAILDACDTLRRRINGVAKKLGIPEHELPDRLPEVAQAFWTRNLDLAAEGWAQGHPVSWDPETGQGHAYGAYAYATHIAEVKVDTITGEIRVERFVAVHDSGKILNRQLATGQVEGGIAQGIGLAITEEIPVQEGRMMVNGFTTYRIPTVRDVAPRTEVDFVEAEWAYGPHGAKGIGEVPLMASHAAVARAVAHALGRSVFGYPLAPETVKRCITEPTSPPTAAVPHEQ